MASYDYFLLGDVNVDLMPGVTSVNIIFEIYGLKQLITNPTRTTPYSSTLIDLCVTNALSKIANERSCISLNDAKSTSLKQIGSRFVQIRLGTTNMNGRDSISNDPNEM